MSDPATLQRLADDYDQEAGGLLVDKKERRDMQATATLFRRMICNRDAADPARITIGWSMLIDIPERWCRQHGYRCVAGMLGYVIQRGDEAAIVARVGDTLRWDGERISVEGQPDHGVC